MAIYVFECPKCNKEFDLSMTISAFRKTIKKTKKAKCPKCGAASNMKPTAAGIHFKGAGWYVTDYKNKSPQKRKDE